MREASDRDFHSKLTNVPRIDTALATFYTLSELQGVAPPVLIAAQAALFLLLCDHYKVAPQDAFTVATNLMNEHDGKFATEFEAIRMFLKEEHRFP